MKADVLSEFDEVRIATGYKTKEGEIANQLIYNIENTLDYPVYSDFAGWSFKNGNSELAELPTSFIDYINFIEENLEIPIEIISIGPRREETILRQVGGL
jgi:adenylosuccinate synthase